MARLRRGVIVVTPLRTLGLIYRASPTVLARLGRISIGRDPQLTVVTLPFRPVAQKPPALLPRGTYVAVKHRRSTVI